MIGVFDHVCVLIFAEKQGTVDYVYKYKGKFVILQAIEIV